LTISVTPGKASVNGVQINGRLDPAHLRLVDARPTDVLPQVLDPLAFDPATGEFRYGAGLLAGVITEPFAVLVLEVQAVATTTGTTTEFLFDFPPTDVSGPAGSVLDRAEDGLVIITPGVTLQGSVDLQGRPARPDASWSIPLTVTITSAGSGAPVQTFTSVTDQNGGFTLRGISPDAYDIRVKGNHTLRNLVPDVNLFTGDNPVSLGLLLEGDVEIISTFNQVVVQDFNVLRSSFNKCQGDVGFVTNADLNESTCVSMLDFGLLSGNFNRSGDVIVTTADSPASSIHQASTSGAVLAFNAQELLVEVGEVVTVTLDVDPRGEEVNGGMVHLSFDPALVEVVAISLTNHLPLILEDPLVDNPQGAVRFAAGLLGQTITDRFTIATLSLKLKAASFGARMTPVVDTFPPTDISGPPGTVLAETSNLTLKTEHVNFLPIVLKP
jgi:hypothetical protein